MDIRDESYYEVARQGSLDKTHPSFDLISAYGRRADKILDIGCGEGTRLNLIKNEKAEKIGIDTSQVAISLAKKQYPSIKFIQTKDRLPFPASYFDFVYSAFVLEHTMKPDVFLKEAVRILSPYGILLLVAPNFGSPNRASPNYNHSRLGKLFNGFKKDLSLLMTSKIANLDWQRVQPQKNYTDIDADTTVEPYLLTLEKFLKNLGIRKIKSSTLWSQDRGFRASQLLFRLFGILNIYPFSYWGPHTLYVGEKI